MWSVQGCASSWGPSLNFSLKWEDKHTHTPFNIFKNILKNTMIWNKCWFKNETLEQILNYLVLTGKKNHFYKQTEKLQILVFLLYWLNLFRSFMWRANILVDACYMSYLYWYGMHPLNCFVVLGDFSGISWCSLVFILYFTGNTWNFENQELEWALHSWNSSICVSFNWMHMTNIISSETGVPDISTLYKESDFPEIPWQGSSSGNGPVTVECYKFGILLSSVSSGYWCFEGVAPRGLNAWCTTGHVVRSQSIKIFIERMPPQDGGNLILYAEAAKLCKRRFV